MADSPIFRNSDRRREARVPARIEVRFKEEREAAKALHTYSINFSSGGLCLRTQKTYDVGAPLSLSIVVQGQEFDLRGVVAWVRKGVIGVRFEDVAPSVKSQLEALALSLQSAG
jgi:uncharacterized protein (TIGR02266 family)